MNLPPTPVPAVGAQSINLRGLLYVGKHELKRTSISRIFHVRP